SPEPPAEPAPKVEPQEQAQPESALPEMTGRQGANTLAQTIHGALAGDAEECLATIAKLEEQGLLSKEDAQALRNWVKENKATRVEAVGSMTKDGKKITRYRIVGDKGKDLLLDLEEPADKATPWKLAQLTPVASNKEGLVVDDHDSLQVAEGFIDAVKRGDMVKARSYVTGKNVSDVTVAGLCMVFAEGGYQLRDRQPIRNSFENEQSSAYLIFLQADGQKQYANVGVEMQKSAADAWQVSAVALGSLLSNYEQTADAEGGRYFPLVKNPQGGDSLALFFAFDDSSLTPRSLRQLGIVAALLKDGQRKLDISGHTDDIGNAGYNEKLSLRRAEAVKAALIDLGVAPEQISTTGMGMRQPRRSYADTAEPTAPTNEEQLETMRAENRRAEIYLDFK
ncbi:MAG: OmpA family protein, partial [Akkermansia sp.]